MASVRLSRHSWQVLRLYLSSSDRTILFRTLPLFSLQGAGLPFTARVQRGLFEFARCASTTGGLVDLLPPGFSNNKTLKSMRPNRAGAATLAR